MIYQFDDFQLDVKKFELRKNGDVLQIGPQVFDFLHLIIKNSSRLVSRDEVIEVVWEGRIVSETTISSCVKAARKVLGDDGGQQRFIRTARGRGFQFIHDVRIIESSVNVTEDIKPNNVSRSRFFVAAAVVISVVLIGVYAFIPLENSSKTNSNNEGDDLNSSPFTIAVMPFEDMSVNGDQDYFGRGVSEEILNVLTGIDDLDVTSRTTAFSLVGQNLSIPEISTKLNVKYVVEGSVRNSGDRVRITAQLIDAEEDSHLWSETYDRNLVDIFAIQDEISIAIANVLQIEIAGGELTREAPTENMEAYSLYLQGHQLFLDRGLGGSPEGPRKLERAIKLLEEAAVLDPNFAEVWADLASSNMLLPTYVENNYTVENSAPTAIDAAHRAINLDPSLSQAWAVKGFIHLNQFQFYDAELALNRAVELNPKNDTAWVWLALHFSTVGHHDEALSAIQKAIEITPDITINYGVMGMILHGQGRIEEAKTVLEEAINRRGFELGRMDRALIAIWENDIEKARSEIEISRQRRSESSNLDISHDINVYIDAYLDPDNREKAYELLDSTLETGTSYWTFVGAYLLLDGEKMVDFFKTTNANKTFQIRRLYNPLVRPIFKQQVFRNYLIEIGLLDYWKMNGFPDSCNVINDNDFMCE